MESGQPRGFPAGSLARPGCPAGDRVGLPPPAGLGRRAMAWLVDALVVAMLVRAGQVGEHLLAATGVEPVARAFLLAYLLVVPAAYLVVGHGESGRTPGKWMMGVRVTRLDGSRVGVGRALGRLACLLALAAPLGMGLLLTAVVILGSSDRRGLHDRLAGTRVARSPLLS